MTVDGLPLGDTTIVVVRSTAGVGEDDYGNPVPGTPQRTSIPGCSVQPVIAKTASETITQTRDLVVSRWHLFAPFGSDIKSSDQIEANGLTLEVDGDLMAWEPDDFGDGYCEAYLKRWEG